jgi:hypothetical protein
VAAICLAIAGEQAQPSAGVGPMAETAKQLGSGDPCDNVGVIWYSSCRASMEYAARNSGSALPPPAPFDFTPLIVLAAIAAGAVLFWMQRAGIRTVAARWLARPIARKGARLKRWRLED